MGTIADKLSYLNNTKQAIKTSLEDKGKDTTGKTFREYAGLIDDIEAGGAIEPFITDASYLFENNRRLNNIEQLLNLISTDCNNTSYMFRGCSTLASLDLSGFNTVNVTNMISMFNGCSTLKSLDLSGFNTDNVTSMSSMFSACRALKSLDLSGFNTVNVTNMSGMFSNCNALTSLDLSSFNTVNVTSMSYMFNDCRALKSLDLSGFNTDNVTSMLNIFNDCYYIDSIIGIDFNNINNARDMFLGCGRLAILTFKSGGSFGGAETNTTSTLTLDLSPTAMTRDSIINMINSCSSNLSGKTRIFKIKTAAFSTLTTDDIALFTDKNYSVISA